MSTKQVPIAALVHSDVIADPYVAGARLKVISTQRSPHDARATIVRLRRFRRAMQTLNFQPDETVTLLKRDAVPVRGECARLLAHHLGASQPSPTQPPVRADHGDVDSQDDGNSGVGVLPVGSPDDAPSTARQSQGQEQAATPITIASLTATSQSTRVSHSNSVESRA